MALCSEGARSAHTRGHRPFSAAVQGTPRPVSETGKPAHLVVGFPRALCEGRCVSDRVCASCLRLQASQLPRRPGSTLCPVTDKGLRVRGWPEAPRADQWPSLG